MRIAVTGGDGFIGRAVCREIEEHGGQSVVIDRRSGTSILDAEAVSGRVKDCDAVIHLAGVLGTSELFEFVELAIDVNVKGAVHVLNACRDHDAAYVGITMPDVWDNLYQATKIAASRIAKAWHRDYGTPVSHVRAFNAYGPGQAYGPGHPQKIVPTFASCSWRGEPIPVWGDGLQTVDLVHVNHIARLLVAEAERLIVQPSSPPQTTDAGTGEERTVLEVAHMVAAVTGEPLLIQFNPMRPGEIPGTRICATDPGFYRFDNFDPDLFAEAVNSYRG